MIDHKFAEAQIKRLSGLDHFPASKEAVKELVLALMACATNDLAEQLVSDYLHMETNAPKPAELRAMAYSRNERAAIQASEQNPDPPRRSHCPTCQDFGIAESIDAADIRSIASYCACEAGRRRAHRPDDTFPERVNAARSKLLKLAIRNPNPHGSRRGSRESMTAVRDILSNIGGKA